MEHALLEIFVIPHLLEMLGNNIYITLYEIPYDTLIITINTISNFHTYERTSGNRPHDDS